MKKRKKENSYLKGIIKGHTSSTNYLPNNSVITYGQNWNLDGIQYNKYVYGQGGQIIPSVDPNVAKIAQLEKELEAARERISELEKELEEKVIVI